MPENRLTENAPKNINQVLNRRYDVVDELPMEGKLVIFDSRIAHPSLVDTDNKVRLAYLFQVFVNCLVRGLDFTETARDWSSRDKYDLFPEFK